MNNDLAIAIVLEAAYCMMTRRKSRGWCVDMLWHNQRMRQGLLSAH